MSEPILLVVKRGATRRFDALQQRTSNLKVEVIWDRRERARRVADGAVVPERRKSDRRQRAPYALHDAEFSVAVPKK